MSSNKTIVTALTICLAITLLGTAGYILIEDYTYLEAFYMAVITLSTVGFGEVKPLSEAGRGFTALFIMLGFAGLAFAMHALVETLLEKVWLGKSEIKKMKKQILRLKSHYLVCGYGRVGKAAAEYFEKAHTPFVIIEADPGQAQEIRDKRYFFLEDDATHEKVLLDAGIKSASGLLALLDSDPDNLFLVLTARDLNPTLYIIARTEEDSSEKKILRAGADGVISPFATAGKQIASDILVATGKPAQWTEHTVGPDAEPQWITIQEGSSMLNETIEAVSMQMGRQVIGLRRDGRDALFPDMETRLQKTDMMLVLDDKRDNENQLKQHVSEPQKILIIDDNPIILRLYTRLFKKSGFYPVTATDGREGLNLIIREKPAAAVIDYMLPVISGIEVCSEVRKREDCNGIKLILFTSDNRSETRKRAIDEGADKVVIKSPEASELIETVIQTLKKDQFRLS